MPQLTSGFFRHLYILGSIGLFIIYFVEIVIFVVVILNVRRLFRFLDSETYNKLRLPMGSFIIFTISFMFFRLGFFIILQFQLDFHNQRMREVLKFTYYMSVTLLIGLLSYIGHKSIKEHDENKHQ